MTEKYIKENDVYNLFPQCGIAKLHVAQIDELPRVDVVEVRQIEKVKQEILERMNEFITEYRSISQSYVDHFGGKAESMEVASRLVNAALTDLCFKYSAKMDERGDVE